MGLHLTRNADRFVVAVDGRFDVQGAEQFRHAVVEQIATDTANVVLDLSGVSFMDASALSGLVQAHHRALACGGSISLGGVSPAAEILLEVTGLDALFPWVDPIPDDRLTPPAAA